MQHQRRKGAGMLVTLLTIYGHQHPPPPAQNTAGLARWLSRALWRCLEWGRTCATQRVYLPVCLVPTCRELPDTIENVLPVGGGRGERKVQVRRSYAFLQDSTPIRKVGHKHSASFHKFSPLFGSSAHSSVHNGVFWNWYLGLQNLFCRIFSYSAKFVNWGFITILSRENVRGMNCCAKHIT